MGMTQIEMDVLRLTTMHLPKISENLAGINRELARIGPSDAGLARAERDELSIQVRNWLTKYKQQLPPEAIKSLKSILRVL